MNQTELEVWLKVKIKSLSSYLEPEDYESAVDSAEEELGWSLPQTNTERLYWLRERSLRHLFFSLMSESAHKFKFEQVNLNQRFEHYRKLISDMDRAFKEAKEENPTLFAGVSSYKLFGTKIDAGFATDDLGRDRTYDEDQIVLHHPVDSK